MKIAIIGGGTAGLAAAYDLTKAGHAATIFEAEPDVGGLAAGFKDERWDWSLEKFYHHWFYNDHDVLDLIEELGCAHKVYFSTPTTSYYHEAGSFALDRAVLPIPLLARVVNVLGMPHLSLIDKLRFGLMGLVMTLYRNGVTLEKHTADTWARRWVGDAAHELIWRPMLIAKFGALYDRVNMAWLWARLYKRTARLGTYEGGFQAFMDDLAARVTGQGGELRLGTPVRALTPRQGGGYTVGFRGGSLDVDQVLSTTSPRLLARLAPGLPDDYRQKLETLVSVGALSMILALDRQLMTDGTYWLNLPARSADKRANPFPFLALVEHTNWLDRQHYGGDHLVYLGDYLPADHEHFGLSDDELAARYLPSLARVAPDFSTGWIRKRWVFRAPYAQPVPFVNHSQTIPAIRTPLAGLYFASMSQVYPWDRGTNYAVEIGRRAARMMTEDAAG